MAKRFGGALALNMLFPAVHTYLRFCSPLNGQCPCEILLHHMAEIYDLESFTFRCIYDFYSVLLPHRA